MGWAVEHLPQFLYLVLLGRISNSNSFSLSHVASSVSICWLICHPLKRTQWSLAHLTWAKALQASGRHRQLAAAGDKRTFQLSVPAWKTRNKLLVVLLLPRTCPRLIALLQLTGKLSKWSLGNFPGQADLGPSLLSFFCAPGLLLLPAMSTWEAATHTQRVHPLCFPPRWDPKVLPSVDRTALHCSPAPATAPSWHNAHFPRSHGSCSTPACPVPGPQQRLEVPKTTNFVSLCLSHLSHHHHS